MDVAVGVDRDLIAGVNDHRAPGVLDDRRPFEGHAHPEPLAVVDGGRMDPLEGEVDLAHALAGRLDARPGRLVLRHGELPDLHRRDEMDADHLDRRVEPVGVLALVGLVEGGLDGLDAVFGHRSRFESHLGRVLLVLVAELPEASERDACRVDPLGRKLLPRARLGASEYRLDFAGAAGREVGEPSHEVVAPKVRHHHAPRGEHRRADRNYDLPHPQLLGERDRVHPAPSPERDQGEVAGVEATVDRHQLEGVHHVVVGDANDAAGGLRRIDAKLRADRLDRPPRRRHVRGRLPAAEEVPVDAPEPEVGIRGGGMGSAPPVGGGTGSGPRRARPDVELAEVIDPCNGAPARADLDEVDHRDEDRIARRGPVPLDPVVGHDPDLPALHEGALGGRPAHVERYHVRLPDETAELGRAPHPRGGAGFDHRDRSPGDRIDRVHPAVRLHDIEASREASLVEPGVKALEIAFRHELHVGGEDRRARALVLAPFTGDLVRGDGRHLRPEPAKLGEGGLLVRRVRVRVNETDCDRLDPGGAKVRDNARERREIEGIHLFAPVAHPPGKLAAKVPRHERIGLAVVEVEEVGSVAARDRERVAEPLGGDEPDCRAGALGERIDDHGGAVRKKVDRGCVDVRLLHDREHAPLELRWGRVGLCGPDRRPAGGLVHLEGDEIGKRPADVGGDADGARGHVESLLL